MPWMPIEESGLEYTFGAVPWVSMTDSIVSVSGTPEAGNSWHIEVGASNVDGMRFRITALDYSLSPFPVTQVAQFLWNDPDSGGQTQENEGADTAFTPSPFEATSIAEDWLSFDGALLSEGTVNESYQFLVEVWVGGDEPYQDPHNCDCDDGTSDNETRGVLRDRLMSLLGYGAQALAPPPGMATLLNNFLDMAQRMLYKRIREHGWCRFYSWPMQQGVTLYDVPANQDACERKLNPRKITWVGIEQSGIYRPLIQGIPPELYTHGVTAQWPSRYEIRQCLEIWPAPAETLGRIVIKGDFGLLPFDDDNARTTVDSDLVFLQALANAKAHYRKPDAGLVQQQVEVMVRDIIAGDHMTARYIPGRRIPEGSGWGYDWPVATPPFPGSP